MIGTRDVLSIAWNVARHARASRDEVIAYQNERLRRLVNHAYRTVPYYRALFDRHGISPDQIRSVADLASVPVTTKRDLQRAPMRDLIAHGLDPDRLIVHTTSGSSGEPLSIRHTWLEERVGSAFRLRALHDFGLRATDRRVEIGLLRAHDARDWDLPQRTMRALGLYRKWNVDCRSAPEEILRRLEELRPDVIAAFPGVFCRIAEVIGKRRTTTLRPRLLISGGEVLTPIMRRQIAEAFRAPVVEHFGTHELGTVAWQCTKRGGFHVADDGVILEVLNEGRPARPGEVGEVVATRLHAFAMPFIRYRLGDLVTQGEAACPCGAPFSTYLDRARADARLLPARQRAVASPLRARRGSHRSSDTVDQPVPAHPGTARSRGPAGISASRAVVRGDPLVEEAARGHLGPGIEFQVFLVPEIPLDANGKFRVSRSLVDSAYDGIDWELRRATDLRALRRDVIAGS